jgi:hypothetical protein
MRLRYLSAGAGILLAGCAVGAGQPVGDVTRTGYLYHDANHPAGSAPASPQAIYNATHSIWLWPPAENDKPGS